MISKLKKIKQLGIFSDYSWDTALHSFGRYNLIYGWNGSGKTTLSNLFAILDSGSTANYQDLEYEVETDSGTVKTGQPFPSKIRVFNPEYVSNNVYNLKSGRAKPIFILGEVNKKIAEQIEADESALASLKANLQKEQALIAAHAKRRETVFSDIAKTIGQNTAGLATRTYRRPEAEKDFLTLKEKVLLNDKEVISSSLELKQLVKVDLAELAAPRLAYNGEEKKIEDILEVLDNESRRLCVQTVESKVIDRLNDNPDIAKWVEQGIELHSKHASKNCEFCDQALPPARMAVLAGHFNEADKELKKEIDNLLGLLASAESAVVKIEALDKANLYDEIQEAYQLGLNKFIVAKSILLGQIGSFRHALDAKKLKTTEAVSMEQSLAASGIVAALNEMNVALRRHNSKNGNFKTLQDTARRKLELHYLSTIFDDVNALEKEIADGNQAVTSINEGKPAKELGITGLTERIRTNRATISSSHKGCQDINSALVTFLGRSELQFEVDPDGYVLKRGDKPATNLSEGERTAIGFVHFIVHLKDQDFDLSKGIVVVDDPVSSLDSNSIFQAFAFLKDSVKDAHQVFLLTHDFDFLRHLLGWLRRVNGKFYMIMNALDGTSARVALIQPLDKLLQGHESEYHYLFKVLHTFKDDGTIGSVYHVPNIARKLLETFLMFRVPSNGTHHDKLESLRPHFDGAKLEAIWRFTNDQSHMTGKGFDPSLVPEAQKNVKHLLEMIQTVSPEHFRILVESIQPETT